MFTTWTYFYWSWACSFSQNVKNPYFNPRYPQTGSARPTNKIFEKAFEIPFLCKFSNCGSEFKVYVFVYFSFYISGETICWLISNADIFLLVVDSESILSILINDCDMNSTTYISKPNLWLNRLYKFKPRRNENRSDPAVYITLTLWCCIYYYLLRVLLLVLMLQFGVVYTTLCWGC